MTIARVIIGVNYSLGDSILDYNDIINTERSSILISVTVVVIL